MREQATAQLQQAACLPADVCFRFDAGREAAGPGGVQKTIRRTVVSLGHGRFQACETVHYRVGHAGSSGGRSATLAALVPPGAGYAFDLIADVGVETYLHGRRLGELQEQLARRQPALRVPRSTLWDQQQQFLFYLGVLHRQAAPVLREYLAHHGPVTWLLDGTTEPETAVFLGIEEAAGGMLLGNWKIPSENVADLVPCLQQAADRYGRPDRGLHDLSPAMSGACEQALPGVSHFVCHQHLARDVGEDLYEAPQAALCKRLRTLRLQLRLKEQRRGQNEWLRQRPFQQALEQLRQELQQQTADHNDPDQPWAQIVLQHLDKYWEHLLPDQPLAAGAAWTRTTNQLEGRWGGRKRRRRRTHGRGKLTRDFQPLPEDYLLTANLENPTYLELVLGGSLESLPAKLAEASRDAGSFDAWRRRRRPRLLGELPRRLLRADDFVDHLLDASLPCCQPPAQRAA